MTVERQASRLDAPISRRREDGAAKTITSLSIKFIMWNVPLYVRMGGPPESRDCPGPGARQLARLYVT